MFDEVYNYTCLLFVPLRPYLLFINNFFSVFQDFAAFEADIDAMKAGGGTAIYESITFACDILRPLALQVGYL